MFSSLYTPLAVLTVLLYVLPRIVKCVSLKTDLFGFVLNSVRLELELSLPSQILICVSRDLLLYPHSKEKGILSSKK